MTTRFIENKSLIDCITPPNELLDVRAIDGGFRFRFSGRVLPEWFKEMAKSLNYAMVDNNASGRFEGRDVSLVNGQYISAMTHRSKRRQ